MQQVLCAERGRIADRRGSALVVALVVVTAMAVLAGAALTFSQAVKNEVVATRDRNRVLYLAEAGVAETLASLQATLSTKKIAPAYVGTNKTPRRRKSGAYWAALTDNGDGTFTVKSTGDVNGSARSIEAVIELVGGGIFENAVFAGNSSGDPNYTLELGGSGTQADQIRGDIFSGGNISVSGDAAISGDAGAAGTITGATGQEGANQPMPDILGADYANNNDYDVASLFSTATWQADDAGGSAWQLPDDSPAHIFRKNPDDRTVENSGTVKDDFYLEDPYTTVRKDANQDGTDAWEISLSGVSGQSKVFYIDGNLWVHSKPTYSYRFVNDSGDPVRVTFVVNGNVTFSDNLFYNDPDQDGVVFIAKEDANVADSGNIYFGDPTGGTLEYMDAYMYAENDFVDTNLSASGSKNVVLNGTMSAGNHVAIERDYTAPDGTVSHSQLVVQFDDRIAEGDLVLPGLPQMKGVGGKQYAVAGWREVSTQ